MSQLINLLSGLPDWLATTIIAATPLVELRASIPIALGVYKMPFFSAVLFSVLGDMIPAVLILRFMGPVSAYASKHINFVDRTLKWWFARTEKKFINSFARYGLMALFIFVAMPLPGTGSWSGALAAFLFRLPFLPSVVAIGGGVVVAALLVGAASLGVIAIF